MNILKSISAVAKRVGQWVSNRFEAARTWTAERSLLFQNYQDARFDADKSTRVELCRKHGYFVSNSWIVQKIRNLFIQFSVGVEGLAVTPNSTDENWNESYSERYCAWCRSPELSSNLRMWELHVQWAGSLFDAGEILIYKTQDERGEPKIQTIDSLRLQTPPEFAKSEGKEIIDGIELQKITVKGRKIIIGKPAFYYIRDEFDLNSYAKIPASQIIHKFKARRPGQMRGIPEGFAALNILHDYEDLGMMEMQAAKLASSIGVVTTNRTGEIDQSAVRRTRMSIQSQNASGTATTKTADQFYDVKFGTSNITMAQGDNVKQFMVDRPTVATEGYWDLLVTQIFCAYNVPKLLGIPFSLQGTVTRADLDVSANAFRANFEIVADAVREIYEWFTEWAVKYDRSIDGKPADYLCAIIRPPRAPNVDVGYNANALALELELGTKTLDDVYAERQQNSRVQLRQIAKTQAYILKLAKEYGVTPESISNTALKSGVSADPVAEAAKAVQPATTEPQPA